MGLKTDYKQSLFGHLPILDGARGIAVLLVVMYHYNFLSIGWLGVDLFFVLSGFLISIKLIESIDKKKRDYYLSFWLKRALRIIPAYFLILMLCFVSLVTIKVDLIGQDHSFWAYPLFIVNWLDSVNGWPTKYSFIHFWSLSCEMQFYLIWPFFLKAVCQRKKLLIIFLITCVLFGVLARIAVQFCFEQIAIARYVLLPCRIDSFALGALLAVLIKFYRSLMDIFFVQAINYFFVGLILLTMFLRYSEWTFSNNFVGIIGISLNAIFWFGILIFALKEKLPFLKSRWLILVGKYSYGMYLYHLPIWLLVKKIPFEFLKNEMILGCLAAVITYQISWVSYNFFEIRFLQLKRKI